jgi:Domain of unknown function (DUF4386)
MEAANRAGRAIGLLFLTQMVAAAVGNFVLLAPVFAAPGFLENAAAHPNRMGVTALLGIATGSLSIAIAILAFPVFRPRSQALALGLVALAVAGFALAVVENANLMSLLSLSQAYARAGAGDREAFQSLRVVVASARNWSHFLGLLVSGSLLGVFHLTLYRFALLPRALAAFGLAAVLSQMISVALPLFGHGVVFPMLAPLGVCQLVVALWLITAGWRARPLSPTPSPRP